ncbi:MAG TPA: hypothetical protein VKB26_00300 [Candidatus Acidoferrales bacterium]|nr:hypothetical protein [Candidatus Acidoferrales bacterium]
MNSATVGSIVGVAFGCAWGLAGSIGLPRQYRMWSVIASIAISAVLIAALLIRPRAVEPAKFDGRLYGIAVAMEAAAIFAAVFALQRLGRQEFLIPTVGFIVGLHFIGLWKASGMPLFLWTASAMCVVCAVAMFLPGPRITGGADARAILSGLGSAVVLWTAGATTLFRIGAR